MQDQGNDWKVLYNVLCFWGPKNTGKSLLFQSKGGLRTVGARGCVLRIPNFYFSEGPKVGERGPSYSLEGGTLYIYTHREKERVVVQNTVSPKWQQGIFPF